MKTNPSNTSIPAAFVESATLTRILTRGFLRVGTSAGIKGMSYYSEGTCLGMDADMGRALSAVIFAAQLPVDFQIVNPEDRFSAIGEARIDVGLYNASKTLERELENDVVFPVVTLIDGEGILTNCRNSNKSFADWDNPVVGIQGGTTSASNIALYRAGRPTAIRSFETLSDAVTALQAGQIDAVVFDTIGLAGVLSEIQDADRYVILPERISRELMGPVVPVSDPIFARLVEWTFAALVQASELGVTSESLDQDLHTEAQRTFLEGGLPIWSDDPQAVERLRALLRATGNSDEIYHRNLGENSDLRLPQGLNASTLSGGIFHPAPV